MKKKFKDMIFVKGGKYTPCFTDDEKEVYDLEVCRYLTTQKMWLEVMENNPSKFKGIYKPVNTVTWWQALEFCNKLSEKYNLEPVYDLSKKRILMINQLGEEKASPDIADFKKTEDFRLPTEVEWEWFASGGEVAIQDGTFDKKYSGSDNPDKVAWHNGNSKEETHEVGTKNPNQLGLYDCSGNVWEWCYDKASYCSEAYLREGNKKELIQSGKLYKYDIKESGIRGEAWTTKKYYFNDGAGYMDIDEDRDAVGIKKGGYYTKTCFYYSIGFRIVRTV